MITKYMDKLKNIGSKLIHSQKRKRKARIPKAIREQCWIKHMGKTYESTCYVDWCDNQITVFDFQVGHDIPESKGGTLNLNNLRPICSRCNLSMGNQYTIQEWIDLTQKKKKCFNKCFKCCYFSKK